MKKYLIIFLLVSLALTGAGCQKKEQPVSVTQLFPLEPGNYWKYSGYGNEFASFEKKVLFRESQRVQVVDINPGTTMAVIYEVRENEIAVIYSEPEFYQETNILQQEGNMNQVILQGPVATGTTWTTNGSTYLIEKTDATVETEAGTFTGCVQIKVSYEHGEANLFTWYKPGLGMVKQEFVATEVDFVVTSLLSDYQVAGFPDKK